MIDLHCHLHYGVDDGPKDLEESMDLARALVDYGVTEVACTSHLRRDKQWVNDIHVQKHLSDRLDESLRENNINLAHVQGAEHYIDELLLPTCHNKEVVPYGNTNWLLVETPYWGEPARLFDLLYNIRKAGYRIVLAHVERFEYLYKNDEKLEQLLNSGYVIQVNLGSLSGMYHREHKKAAIKLISEGYAGIVGGDCHRAKDVKPSIGEGATVLRKMVGEQGAEVLMTANPRKILSGADPVIFESYGD